MVLVVVVFNARRSEPRSDSAWHWGHGVVFVSVVVVVTGLRTVVSSDEVVVVREEVPSLLQADSDNRAVSARQDRISFFIMGSGFGLFCCLTS
jgi:hypothetical protein